jgi:hypothetical protein
VAPSIATKASRAIVSNDGSTIWLTAYTEAGDAVPVALAPVRAVALAGELIEAAVPKLGSVAAEPAIPHPAIEKPIKRRGGDRHAAERRELHDGLRAIAGFRKREGKPLVMVAREVIGICDRCQPMPEETDPERLEVLRVRKTGLRVPGVRQVVSIISE